MGSPHPKTQNATCEAVRKISNEVGPASPDRTVEGSQRRSSDESDLTVLETVFETPIVPTGNPSDRGSKSLSSHTAGRVVLFAKSGCTSSGRGRKGPSRG